jgi:hypothetical protein
VVLGAVVLAGGGAVVWKMRHKELPPPPPAVVEVAPAPPPVAPTPPPEPPKAEEPPPPPIEVGSVKVTSSPTGAPLVLDGVLQKHLCPSTLEKIEAGKEHTLVAQLNGYKDGVQKFTLTPSQVMSINFKLVRESRGHGSRSSHGSPAKSATPPVAAAPAPAPAPAPEVPLTGEGTLVVASSPWCNVSVDGSEKGQTPVSVKLPAGKHTVVLTNPEFKISRTLPVMILPNETLRKKLDFAQ